MKSTRGKAWRTLRDFAGTTPHLQRAFGFLPESSHALHDDVTRASNRGAYQRALADHASRNVTARLKTGLSLA